MPVPGNPDAWFDKISAVKALLVEAFRETGNLMHEMEDVYEVDPTIFEDEEGKTDVYVLFDDLGFMIQKMSEAFPGTLLEGIPPSHHGVWD